MDSVLISFLYDYYIKILVYKMTISTIKLLIHLYITDFRGLMVGLFFPSLCTESGLYSDPESGDPAMRGQ